MPSKEQIEEYRRMTPGQRLEITLKMIRDSTPSLFKGTPYQVARRFERIRQANDERNLRICEGLARAEKRIEQERANRSDDESG